MRVRGDDDLSKQSGSIDLAELDEFLGWKLPYTQRPEMSERRNAPHEILFTLHKPKIVA